MKSRFLLILVIFLLTGSAFAENLSSLNQAQKYFECYQNCESDGIKEEYLNYSIRYFKRALMESPSSIEAMVGLSQAYLYDNSPEKALEILNVARNMYPVNPQINFLIGMFKFKQNQYLEASQYLQTALKSGYSNNYSANFYLYESYKKMGDLKAAKNYLEKCIQLKPNDDKLKQLLLKLDEYQNNLSVDNVFNSTDDESENIDEDVDTDDVQI